MPQLPGHSSAEIADQLINGAIAEAVTKATSAAIKAQVAWLPLWVIEPIVGKILGIAFKEAAKFIAFTLISIDNEADRARYDEAAGKLKETVSTPADHFGGEEQKNAEIQKAHQEFKNRLRDLVRFGR